MRTYRALDVDRDGDVLTVAFDRPDRHNAIGERLHDELSTVFHDVGRHHDDARVVVLTGNGRSFSAGGDLDWLEACLEDPAMFRRVVREGETIVRGLLQVQQPIVARINGDATGFGATLALLADLSVMSADARIGDPHVQAGLVAGDGGAAIWPLLVGINRAKEFLLTGELVDGPRAAELGLVNHVVDPADLDDRVAELIADLAAGPQVAIRYTKMATNAWLRFAVDRVLRESLAFEAVSQRHPDHAEALAAFREGRDPEFPSGR